MENEVRKEVKVIKVDYLCPKCKTGHLRPNGSGLLLHEHICDNLCGYTESFEKEYPYIDYIEVDE